MYIQHKPVQIFHSTPTNTRFSATPVKSGKAPATDYFDGPKFQGGERTPLLSRSKSQTYADGKQQLASQNMVAEFEKRLKTTKAELKEKQKACDTFLKELAFLAFEHSLYTRKVNLHKYGGIFDREWDYYQVDYLPAEVEGKLDQKQIKKLTHSHSLINWNAETVLLDVLGDRGWEYLKPRESTAKNKTKLTPEEEKQLSEIEMAQEDLAKKMTGLKEKKLALKQNEIEQCQREISRIETDLKKFNADFKK